MARTSQLIRSMYGWVNLVTSSGESASISTNPAAIQAVEGSKFTGVSFRNVPSSGATAPVTAFATTRVGVNDVLSTDDASVLAS